MTIVEEQKHLRTFVKNLLVGTINGSMQPGTCIPHPRAEEASLAEWVEGAVGEKFQRDLRRVYPATLLAGTGAARAAVADGPMPHIGSFYLAKEETLVLVRVVSKARIAVIRTGADEVYDQAVVGAVTAVARTKGIACNVTAVVYVPYDSNRKADVWTWASDGSAQTRAKINGLALAVITRQSARDVQRLPGPSDLSNPCDICVARKIAGPMGIHLEQPASDFSLKAWVGTAVHQKIENDLPKVYSLAKHEITVTISEILGLGQIKGHVDLHLPDEMAMTDFKTTDLKRLAGYRSSGVPVAHAGQTMLYCYGLRKAGEPVKYATLAYIPRDSNEVDSIWVASCPYREDVAIGLLNRTQHLVEVVRSGDTSTLESYADCWVCNKQHWYAK